METLKRLTDKEALCLYKKQIKKDFEPEEFKPVWVVRKQLKEGRYFCDVHNTPDGTLVSYAFVLEDRGRFFLDYFAVVRQMRGRGHGTQMLRTLFDRYDGPWIFEVEDPGRARNGQEREQMEKRIRFYEHAGAQRTAARVTAFGHPYCLMVAGQSAEDAKRISDQYLDIYGTMLGRNLSRWIQAVD